MIGPLKRLSYVTFTPLHLFIALMVFGFIFTAVAYARVELQSLQMIAAALVLVLYYTYTGLNSRNLFIRKLGSLRLWQASSLVFAGIRHEGNRGGVEVVRMLRQRGRRRKYYKHLTVKDIRHNFEALPRWELERRLKIFSESFSLEDVNVSLRIIKRTKKAVFRLTLCSDDPDKLREAVRKVQGRLEGMDIFLDEAEDDLCTLVSCESLKLDTRNVLTFVSLALTGVGASTLAVPAGSIGVALLLANGSALTAGLMTLMALRGISTHTNLAAFKDAVCFEKSTLYRNLPGQELEASRFLAVTAFDTTYQQMKLEKVKEKLQGLNELIHSDFDLDLVLHASPEPRDLLVSKLQKQQDLYYSSYQTGGALSHLSKAFERRRAIQRMKGEEQPYSVTMIAKVSVRGDPEGIEGRVTAACQTFRTSLSTLGLRAEDLRDYDLVKAVRLLHMPPDRAVDLHAYTSRIKSILALTYDYAWLSPFALDRKPVLSPNGILLGVDDRGVKVHWDPNSLANPHMTVLGLMGTGKTTVARTIVLRARRSMKIPLIIIDPSGEYASVVEELGGVVIDLGNLKLNPLLLSGVNPIDRATNVVEMAAYAVGLNSAEQVLLRKAVTQCYAQHGIDQNRDETWTDRKAVEVTLAGVAAHIQSEMETYDDVHRLVAETLLFKLEPITTGKYGLNRTDVEIAYLMEKSAVLCLSLRSHGEDGKPIPLSQEMQKALVWSLLEQLYGYLTASTVQERVRVIIIVDEAHLFAKHTIIREQDSSRVVEPPLSLHLRMLRKFGASYILITHVPEDFPSFLYKTVGTLLAFGSTDPEYLAFCSKNLNLLKQDEDDMTWFKRGGCFLRVHGDPRPIKLTVKPEPSALTATDGAAA